jgi:uncharacterized LabA/DUF88 family protein
MVRVMFFVDGFNLYHAIDKKKEYHKYKWLNLKRLCECFMTKREEIGGIKYFTAYSTWRPDSMQRHMVYVKALRTIGIEPIFGKFRWKDRKCKHCGKIFIAHEEKRTDVNIAVTLLADAMLDNYDKAIVISADADLIPAIQTVKSNFPDKNIGIVIPIGRSAEELEGIVDFHMRLKEKHLKLSQFEDSIDLGNGVLLKRPESWK